MLLFDGLNWLKMAKLSLYLLVFALNIPFEWLYLVVLGCICFKRSL
jgi:hypothetical protein